MRKKCGAVWCYAVEPKTGHGPGEKTWPLVFSFLRHTFAARVPAEADPLKGPVAMRTLDAGSGWLGQNWDAAAGGYQSLAVAPFASFAGEKATASWLVRRRVRGGLAAVPARGSSGGAALNPNRKKESYE
jgi:hypothetical protein